MSPFFEYFLLAIFLVGVVLVASIFGVLLAWYHKAKSKKCDAVFNFDPNVKTTTHLPIPLAAAECRHSWSVVDKQVLDMQHEQKYVMTMKCDLCGVIDKTIEVTSKQPPPQPGPPCKHEWEVVEKCRIGGENSDEKTIVILKCTKCGILDKTTESTKYVVPPVSKSECRHRWVVEKAVCLESPYEQMFKSAKHRASNLNELKTELSKLLNIKFGEEQKWVFRKGIVSVRTCSECGEVDKTVAYNYNLDEEEES